MKSCWLKGGFIRNCIQFMLKGKRDAYKGVSRGRAEYLSLSVDSFSILRSLELKIC